MKRIETVNNDKKVQIWRENMKKRICKMLTLVMTGSMVLGVTSPVHAEKKDDVTKISFAIWDEVQNGSLCTGA